MDISIYNEDNIIRVIDHGAEGIVYLYKDNGEEVALKIYNRIDSDHERANENKELKLLTFKNELLLQNDIKLLNRVYSMGKFIGFTSVYDPYMPLSFIDKRDKKIQVLKLIRDRYEELNKHDIYIGDFNIDNFSLKDNRIKLYDIDNFRIGDLDFNIVDAAMMEYRNKCKYIENIDYFCFNYFALGLISSVEVEAILSGYGRKEFPRELKTKEVQEFINMLDNFNDNTIIERTKDGKPKTLLNLLK